MKRYEVIKGMTIDELAAHHAIYGRAAIKGALEAMGLTMQELPPLEVTIKNQKEWLLKEVAIK